MPRSSCFFKLLIIFCPKLWSCLLNKKISFLRRLNFALKVIFFPKSFFFKISESENANLHQIGTFLLTEKTVKSLTSFDSLLDGQDKKNDNHPFTATDPQLHLIPNDHLKQQDLQHSQDTSSKLQNWSFFNFIKKQQSINSNKDLLICTDINIIFNELIAALKIFRKNSKHTQYVPFNSEVLSLLTKILQHPNAMIQVGSKSISCIEALRLKLADLSVFGVLHFLLNKGLQSMIKCDSKSLEETLKTCALLIDYELCSDDEINNTTELLISNFVSYALVGTTLLPKLLQSKQYSKTLANLDLIGVISFSHNVCSLIERLEHWLNLPQELKNALKYDSTLNRTLNSYDFSAHPIEQIPFIQQYFSMQHKQLTNIVDIFTKLHIPIFYSAIPAGAIFHAAITEDLYHLDAYVKKFNKKPPIEQDDFLSAIFSSEEASIDSIFSLKEHYLTLLQQKQSNQNSMQLEFDFEQSKQDLQQINDALQIFEANATEFGSNNVFCSFEQEQWCAMDIFYLFLLKTYNMHSNDLTLSTFATNLINKFSVNLQSTYLDQQTPDSIRPEAQNTLNKNTQDQVLNLKTNARRL